MVETMDIWKISFGAIGCCKVLIIFILMCLMLGITGLLDGKPSFVLQDMSMVMGEIFLAVANEQEQPDLLEEADKLLQDPSDSGSYLCRLILHNFNAEGAHVNFGSISINGGTEIVNMAVGVERDFTVTKNSLKDSGWRSYLAATADPATWQSTLKDQIDKFLKGWTDILGKIDFDVEEVVLLGPNMVFAKVVYTSQKFNNGEWPRWYIMLDGKPVSMESDLCAYDPDHSPPDVWVAEKGLSCKGWYAAAVVWAMCRIFLTAGNVVRWVFFDGNRSPQFGGRSDPSVIYWIGHHLLEYTLNALGALFLSLQVHDETPMLVTATYSSTNFQLFVAAATIGICSLVCALGAATLGDFTFGENGPTLSSLLMSPLCFCSTGVLVINCINIWKLGRWSFLISWGIDFNMSWPNVSLAAHINALTLFVLFLIILDTVDILSSCVQKKMDKTK